MYSISSAQWTWLSGNNTGFVHGVYGTIGVPSLNHYPGGRNGHSMVFDADRNSIYAFGGFGYAQIPLLGTSPLLG
jgi:hypothetical protein